MVIEPQLNKQMCEPNRVAIHFDTYTYIYVYVYDTYTYVSGKLFIILYADI